jgi:hypothetical protein
MEMKLFDIETRRYETDFAVAGNKEFIMPNLSTREEGINKMYQFYIKQYGADSRYWDWTVWRSIADGSRYGEHKEYKTEPQGTLKTFCDLTGAVVYGGRYVLMKCEKYDIGLHYDLPNENELDWYGYDVIERGINTKEYDVIKNFTFTIGDVFLKYDKYDIVSIGHSSTHYSYHQSLRCRRFEDRCCAGLVRTVIEGNDCEYVCNIFEEYSKSLCNEENKLEEIINLIK